MSVWRNGTSERQLNGSSKLGRQRRARAFKAACESLETRRLFSTDTWITLGSGDWSVGSNWSEGHAPQANEDVVIDVRGLSVAVTYTGNGTIHPHNLLNNNVLEVLGGTLAWTGGTWSGSGEIENDALLAISGSADKILADGQELLQLGNTTQTGTGNIVGQVGALIENEGMWDIQSDSSITFPSGVGTGYFLNYGNLTKSGGTGVSEIGGAQGFTFESRPLPIGFEYDASPPNMISVQSGTLRLGDDQNVSNDIASAFTIAAGATLDLDRGTFNFDSYRHNAFTYFPSIIGAGTLSISGANATFYGTYNVHKTVVTAGSLTININTENNNDAIPEGHTSELDLIGGTIGGNGGGTFATTTTPVIHFERSDLIVDNIFNWTGGGFAGNNPGRVSVAEDATATISGLNPKTVNGGVILDLFSVTQWNDNGTITIGGTSRIWIQNSGTLSANGEGSILGGVGGGQLWNEGNFIKTDVGGATVISGTSEPSGIEPQFLKNIFEARPAAGFNNTGNYPYYDAYYTFETLNLRFNLQGAILKVAAGTLAVGGTSYNGENILIEPGATLAYTDGTHDNENVGFPYNSPASILGVAGGGTLDLTGTATLINGPGSLLDVPNVIFGAGNYEFDNPAEGDQVFTNAIFNGGTTGVITGQGGIKILGSFLWNSGTFNGPATSKFLIYNGATLTIPSGNRVLGGAYSLDNRGRVLWTTSPGTLTIGGNYVQTATGELDLGLAGGEPPAGDQLSVNGTVTIDAGATIVVTELVTPAFGDSYVLIANNNGNAPISGVFANLANASIVTIGATAYAVDYAGGDGNDLELTATVIPAITIATPAGVVEGNTGATPTVTFTVSLSQAVAQPVSVNYATAGGTATSGVDFLATAGTLVIPAGATTGTIVVTVIGDTVIESNETFTVTLSSPVNGVLGTPAVATGTIIDDDSPPVFSFLTSPFSAVENSGQATISVTRTNPLLAASVDYAAGTGTATAGLDFTAVNGTLSFPIGVVTETFVVPIIDDTIYEGDESVALTLTNAVGGSVATPTGVLTIVDNEAPPVLSVSSPLADENAGVLPFTLSIPSVSGLDTTVTYATADGTAVNGVNYTAEAGSATIPAGQTRVIVNVPIEPTTTPHGPINFTFNLTSPVNSTLAVSSGTGTINSNVGSFSFDTSTDSVRENAGTLTFTVLRTGGTIGTATVNYTTADGTAVAGTDYTAANSTLTFADGQTSATFTITVIKNYVFAPDKVFTVKLNNPGNFAVLGQQPTATVTITNTNAAHGITVTPIRSRDGVLLRVFNAATLAPELTVQAYTGVIRGEIRVATGDINGDGVPDLAVTYSGSNTIETFDGATGAPMASYQPFGRIAYDMYIALGDVNDDGLADIVSTTALFSTVNVIDAATGVQMAGPVGMFQAFGGIIFRSGVPVAVGDINNDGHGDIIVGAGQGRGSRGGGSTAEAFSGVDATMLEDIQAYDPRYHGGVYVAAGDVNGDHFDDIVTAPRQGYFSLVEVYNGNDGSLQGSFSAFGTRYRGATSIAVTNVNGDGHADILATGIVERGFAEVRSFTSFDASQYLVYDVQNASIYQPYSAGA